MDFVFIGALWKIRSSRRDTTMQIAAALADMRIAIG
jgi:hypothetical protein